MKCALIIVALLVCVQLTVGQTTTATVAEYYNNACNGTGTGSEALTVNSGTCFASGASSLQVTCGASTNTIYWYPSNTGCNNTGTGGYYMGTATGAACTPITASGGTGTPLNWVTITCTTTGAAAATAVSGLLLAVLAFFAMQKL